MRSRTLTIEHRVVILLGTLDVLIPPLTKRWHIVAGDGANRAVWVATQMAKLHARVLWHTLQLKAQYLQLIHHPRHAIRHHTEVFGTYQHTGSLHQLRQLLHRLTIPILVVTTIEVVVVKAVERSLVIIIERLEDEVCAEAGRTPYASDCDC